VISWTKYILSFFILFFGKNVFAQNSADTIAQRNIFQYRYKGKVYSRWDLGREVLENDPASARAFENYQGANLVTLSSVGILAVEIYILFRETDHCDRICRKTKRHLDHKYLEEFLAVQLGIPIVSFISSRIKFLKSIRLFNESRRGKTDLGKVPLQLKLQSTNHGIGFVLNF